MDEVITMILFIDVQLISNENHKTKTVNSIYFNSQEKMLIGTKLSVALADMGFCCEAQSKTDI